MKQRSPILQKCLMGVLIVVFILLQISLWGDDGWFRNIELNRFVDSQTAENAKLRQNNKRLNQEVLNVKSENAVIEELAREELGMVKEGETFYRIIKRQNNDAQTSEQ